MTELANIMNVPIITTGTFQGHKGPPVVVDNAYYRRMLKASNKFRPYLKEAMQTGVMPGNPDFFQRLGKPMPAPITFNHEVLEDDKIKESLKNVEVEFAEDTIISPEFPDGKLWMTEKFSGVDPLAADIIRRFFTKRSVEIMELTDPETGSREPVVISTAFLSNSKVPPAVPGQTDDLFVEFAGQNESHYYLYPEQGVTAMQEPTTQHVDSKADVSELQQVKDTLAELQAQLAAEKLEKDKAVELAMQEKKAKDAEIAELKAFRNSAESDKFIMELSRIRHANEKAYQVSPAFLDIVKPVIQAGGVVELAEGQSQRQAMYALIDEIAELAASGGLVVPLSTQGADAFQPPKPKSDDEQMKSLVAELRAADPNLTKTDAEKKAFIAFLNRKYGGNK